MQQQEEQVNLGYHQGSSDKVYRVHLLRSGAGFIVDAYYGRRGSSLNYAAKIREPVPYEQAKRKFDAVIRGKLAKGYEIEGAEPLPQPKRAKPLKVSKKLQAAADKVAKSGTGPGVWF